MKKETARNLLVAIIIITFLVRFSSSLFIDNLSYDSYFHVRQVENIRETGLPLFEDSLSYGGREFVFLPLFHYIAAALSFIIPLPILTKLLPNLLVALLPGAIYAISLLITKERKSSIFAAIIAALLPSMYNVNSFTPLPLFTLLSFSAIYFFLQHRKNKQFLFLFIATLLILSFVSAATILIIIGLLIYLLLSYIEERTVLKSEVELIIFSLFFFVWSQFIFFKQTFLQRGISFIWQNVPTGIISEYFPSFTLAQVLVLIGVVPFLVGIYVVYRSLFKTKNKGLFLLISFVLSTSFLAWVRVIPASLSLTFFSVILSVLIAPFVLETNTYLKKTKFANKATILSSIFIVVTIISLVIPSIFIVISQETPDSSTITALEWIHERTPETAIIAANVHEGHLISQAAKRANLLDEKFTLAPNVEDRFAAMESLYTTPFETNALSITQEYNIQYILLSPLSKREYNISQIPYYSKECFQRVFELEDTVIYNVKCGLQEQ